MLTITAVACYIIVFIALSSEGNHYFSYFVNPHVIAGVLSGILLVIGFSTTFMLKSKSKIVVSILVTLQSLGVLVYSYHHYTQITYFKAVDALIRGFVLGASFSFIFVLIVLIAISLPSILDLKNENK